MSREVLFGILLGMTGCFAIPMLLKNLKELFKKNP